MRGASQNMKNSWYVHFVLNHVNTAIIDINRYADKLVGFQVVNRVSDCNINVLHTLKVKLTPISRWERQKRCGSNAKVNIVLSWPGEVSIVRSNYLMRTTKIEIVLRRGRFVVTILTFSVILKSPGWRLLGAVVGSKVGVCWGSVDEAGCWPISNLVLPSCVLVPTSVAHVY